MFITASSLWYDRQCSDDWKRGGRQSSVGGVTRRVDAERRDLIALVKTTLGEADVGGRG